MPTKTLNIVVTGTTSGFGALLMRRLLAHGHRVITGVRGGSARFQDADLRLAIQTGALKALSVDFSDHKSWRPFFEELGKIDSIDALVNNAGMGFLDPFELVPENRFREQMEVNFFSVVELTRALLPKLRQSRGAILNVSSVAGRIGLPFYSAYCASKFAIEGWSECLRYETLNDGVSVYLVEPGNFRTGFVNRVLQQQERQPTLMPVGFRKFLETKNSLYAQNPERVADLMANLIRKRPRRFRYLIGNDAVVAVFLRWLMPTRWFEAATALVFDRISRGS